MDIEQWATSPTVSSTPYWEAAFPGHGAKIVLITSVFQNWKPTFGSAPDDLQQTILSATQCFGMKEVLLFSLKNAQAGQQRVSLAVNSAYKNKVTDNTHGHLINDAVGDAFGPVIGPPKPPVMLRAWLYGLLTSAIAFELTDDIAMTESVKTVLSLWKRGIYLIGFDTCTHSAIVITGE